MSDNYSYNVVDNKKDLTIIEDIEKYLSTH